MATMLSFDVFARDRASSTFDKVGRSVDQSRSKLERLHRAGAAAGKALGLGLAVAGVAAVKMANAAAEDERAQVKLATALRNATGATSGQVASVEAWITAQGKALGVADDQLRPALSRLAVATGDVGKAQRLASLAMDVSAGTGKSLQTVTEALAKAQNGNLGGLARLGVATKDASGKTKSLRDITKDLAAAYSGQAAKAAETTAGKQQRLQVAFSELQEEIGAKLLPALLKLADIGLKTVEWVDKNQTAVGILLGTMAGLTATVWAVSAATKAWVAIQTIASVATKVWAAGQWLLNAALTANPIGLAVVAIAALVAGIVIAYQKSETFRAIVSGAFDGVKIAAQAVASFFTKQVPAAFNKVTGAASSVLGWVKRNWPTILAVLTGPVGLAALFISKKWGDIKAGAQSVVEFVKGIPGKLKDLGSRFGDAGKALIKAFVDGMKNAAGIISGIAGNVWDAVRGLLNGAIGKINAALEFKISLPGPDISINPPNIPLLAKGGIVTRATLAVLGEAGPEAIIPLSRAPQFLPPPTRDAVVATGGDGDGMEVNFNGPIYTVDPHETARLIAQRQREMLALVRA